MHAPGSATWPCSIARTLEIAGGPWSPLILRDVWEGINRFDGLQRELGIGAAAGMCDT